VREMNVSRARDPVHAGDKALTLETPAKRERVNRYEIQYLHELRDRTLPFINFYMFTFYSDCLAPISNQINYFCNQCISPLKLKVQIPLIARCT